MAEKNTSNSSVIGICSCGGNITIHETGGSELPLIMCINCHKEYTV